jgi:hypothetical protein
MGVEHVLPLQTYAIAPCAAAGGVFSANAGGRWFASVGIASTIRRGA